MPPLNKNPGSTTAWACWGGRVGRFVIFKFCIAFLLIIDGVTGFGPNLDAFMRLLLNKRAHETLKHNSLKIFLYSKYKTLSIN